ncbi:MAG: YgfZ/GcvT domain-containing protein [Alphaproteobacteria bacterium]
MAEKAYTLLDSRGLVAVGGEAARPFLQGLISQDIDKVDEAHAAYGALLTPQGKYLHDFFITEASGALLLDCEAARAEDLAARLGRYKLRAKVTIEVDPGRLAVAAAFGPDAAAALDLADDPGAARPVEGGVAYVDPRLAALGCRVVLPRPRLVEVLEGAGFAATGFDGYDALRLALGVPDGSRDLELEKSILLESNFEELNGVDWRKGCFVGQELTARTKYRGLVKKRLTPVAIEGPTPEPGTEITAGGKTVGVMRSCLGGRGIALLRVEALEQAGGTAMTAGAARVEARRPGWAPG